MEDVNLYKDRLIETQNLLAAVQDQLEKERLEKFEPIAVVGMAFRFPGKVNNASDFWNLLVNGIDGIEDIPTSRWDNNALYDSGKINHRQGGFVDNIDLFDPSFFDITPIELENTDPEQRLLLETTFEAFENAGIDITALTDTNTSVYIGISNEDYQNKNFRTADMNLINMYSFVGNSIAAASGRISYMFGFQGPSMTIDTGCSSSLVSAHLGVQALRNRETDLAVVGAANLLITPEYSITYSQSGGLSPDARSKAFDNSANGYVRSDGICTLLLKRLSDAQRNNDNILALIKGTAVNQDGRSEHFSVPNNKAQAKAIKAALANANISPGKISYLEAHGTGTRVGDPLELRGILEVYNDIKSREDPLLIGSVKSNIGHTEGVAGIAGLAKIILALKHNTIPANLHFNTPNTLVDWETAPVKVVNINTEWKGEDRHAGINSFGITGTNAHIIVSDPPSAKKMQDQPLLRKDIYVLPLSARSEQALIDLSKKYADFLTAGNYNTEDICAMAALRRTHHEFREVFIADSKAGMIETLNDFSAGATVENKKIFDNKDEIKTVFIFPGQGAQWIQMGKALMENELVYRTSLEEINVVYKNYIDWDLLEEINKPEGESRLNEIDVVQPVLIAIEIALASLWMSKGVFPDIVVGHSLGEVAAAYVAGNISLHEAAQIIITRSKLMKQLSGKGEMGVTDLTVEEANEILKGYEGKLSVAVMNSTNSTVLSGDAHALDEVFSALEAQGRFNRKVKVDVASHSPQMDGIREDLKNALHNIQPQNSTIQFYSTAENRVKNGEALNADYWAGNLRNPVQFGNVIQSISNDHNAVYIEMSPHPVLVHAINENITGKETKALALSSYAREKNELQEFFLNYVSLYKANFPFDWKNIYQDIREFIELPNYAWQKERFWFDEKPDYSSLGETPAAKNIEKYFYEIEWNEVQPSPETTSKNVLVVKDEYGYSANIESILSEKGHNVGVVNNTDSLDGIKADTVIYLSNLKKDTSYRFNFETDILPIQSMVKYFSKTIQKTTINIVSNGAHIVNKQTKTVNLNSSLLSGFIRTIENEYADISFRHIDISAEISESEIQQAASLAFIENEYKEIAVRQNRIWSDEIIPLKSREHQHKKTIDPDATYIVTGGNNGLGLETVKWLLERNAKNIAVISRNGLKNEFSDHQYIKEYKCDVADYEALKENIARLKIEMPLVKGIIHAAGVVDDGTFENLTKEKFEHTLYAKSQGGWNLHQIFINDPLDLFVGYSSVGCFLGAPGQSNYAAACTFLDSLCQFRRNNGMAGTTINWGTIAEIGLAAQQANRGSRLVGHGLKPIYPGELFQFFDLLILSEAAQEIVMNMDFDKWAEYNPKFKNNYFYSKVLTHKTRQPEQGSQKITSFVNMQSLLKHVKLEIKQHISSTTKLSVNKIKEDDTFKSIGVDSLLALQIKNKLQTSFDLPMNVSVIWAHPTVNKLADFIATQLKEENKITIYSGENEESTMASNAAKGVIKPGTLEEEIKKLSLDELLKQLSDEVN
ncbi:MAG: polyketide synthase [Bacteroidota bacterium]|nr:polyketide synthase [Bacteroidota bacterium]